MPFILKRNTVSRENLFHMAQGMVHLHAEIPRVKKSIAHRDIKSKNWLRTNSHVVSPILVFL